MFDTCNTDRGSGKASVKGQSASMAVAMDRSVIGKDGDFSKNDSSSKICIGSVLVLIQSVSKV